MIGQAQLLEGMLDAGGISDERILTDLIGHSSNSHIVRQSWGIIVNVESWKTYVYSISGGSATYRTGSLEFNILAVMS